MWIIYDQMWINVCFIKPLNWMGILSTGKESDSLLPLLSVSCFFPSLGSIPKPWPGKTPDPTKTQIINTTYLIYIFTLITRWKSDCLISICQVLGGGGESGGSNLFVQVIIVLSLIKWCIYSTVCQYSLFCLFYDRTPSITLCRRAQ